MGIWGHFKPKDGSDKRRSSSWRSKTALGHKKVRNLEWFMKASVFLHSEVFFRQCSLDIRYTQGQALTLSLRINICDRGTSRGNKTPFRCSLESNRLHFPYIFVVCFLVKKQILTLLKLFFSWLLRHNFVVNLSWSHYLKLSMPTSTLFLMFKYWSQHIWKRPALAIQGCTGQWQKASLLISMTLSWAHRNRSICLFKRFSRSELTSKLLGMLTLPEKFKNLCAPASGWQLHRTATSFLARYGDAKKSC